MAPDYYHLLGIPRTATDADIRGAFRRKARELHPDVNPSPDAKQRFQELNAAYQTLSDPVKRSVYDRMQAPSGPSAPPRPRPSPPRSTYRPPTPPRQPTPPSSSSSSAASGQARRPFWSTPPQTPAPTRRDPQGGTVILVFILLGLIAFNIQNTPLAIFFAILLVVGVVFPIAVGYLAKHKRWIVYGLLVIAAVGAWLIGSGILYIGLSRQQTGLYASGSLTCAIAFPVLFAIGLVVIVYGDFLNNAISDGQRIEGLKPMLTRAAIVLAATAAIFLIIGIAVWSAIWIFAGATLFVMELVLGVYTWHFATRKRVS